MKTNKGISVIVPVYNVEKYIEKCLLSFVEQENIDGNTFEVIVINDGTKDNSMDIVEKYQKEHPDIFKVFNKKNGGLSDARNYGIKKASYDYITFVDSDDWVTSNYIQLLSDHIEEDNDILIFDAYEINDGWQHGTVIETFKGKEKTVNEFVKYSSNPAFACAKMYKKSLFDNIAFPKPDIWYEDIATIPIVISNSNKIDYLQEPLYYYRQHGESITSQLVNKRNLEILVGIERVLKHVNKKYIKEAEYAMYFSLYNFISFRPSFVEEYIEFSKKNKKRFEKNDIIMDEVKNGRLEKIWEMRTIPKKIHYFWFGDAEPNDLMKACIKSWEEFAPDYEIIKWDETNCDLNENQYVKEAYEAKKWAFVSDYFRTKRVYDHGGIYMDTDMELIKPIDELILHEAFFQFETNNVAAGMFGAIKNHPIMEEWYKSYSNDKFLNDNGTFNTMTIVPRLTKILNKRYDIKYNCENQFFDDKTAIYAPDFLMIDVYNGNNIAIHHYEATWWDTKIGVTSYKYTVLEYFFRQKSNVSLKIIILRKLDQMFRSFVAFLKKLLPKRMFNGLRSVFRKIKGVF